MTRSKNSQKGTKWSFHSVKDKPLSANESKARSGKRGWATSKWSRKLWARLLGKARRSNGKKEIKDQQE